MYRPSPISGILIGIVYFETIELNIDTKKYLDQDITRQGTYPYRSIDMIIVNNFGTLSSTINNDFDTFKNLLIQLNDSICIDKDHPDYQYCHHIQNEIIN